MTDIASDDDINFVIHQGPETVGKTHYAIACELRQHRDAATMWSHPGVVWAKKEALADGFKADEERLLRKIDALGNASHAVEIDPLDPSKGYRSKYDNRWLSIARTHIQEGFNAIERAILQRSRVKLPEDT